MSVIADRSSESLPESSQAFQAATLWPVLRLAWPVLCQNGLISVVALFDRWMAGQLSAAPAATAGLTTATYLTWLLISYTMLVTTGSTTLTAYLIGAGDRRNARHVLHQSLGLAFVLGMIGTALGLALLEPFLRMLQLEGEALTYAASYLRPLLLAMTIQMVGQAGIACLAGAGDTRTGLYVLGAVAVLNMPLAYLFAYGLGPIPPLGFVGIAVGTAVSQTLGGLAVLAFLWCGRAGLRLRLGDLRISPDLLRRLLRISVPAALDSLSMQVGYLWFVAIVNTLGDTASAAHGHALAWEGIGYMLGAAFSTAAITTVGQYKGAGRMDLAKRGGWVSFALGAAIMSLTGTVFFTLATPMLQAFCPYPEQQPIVATGVQALRLVAFGMPALAACMIFAAALRGAGDTRVPVLFTWVGFFLVRIPLAYLFTGPLGMGLVGAWWAMFADMHVRGLALLWRFASGRWQQVRI